VRVAGRVPAPIMIMVRLNKCGGDCEIPIRRDAVWFLLMWPVRDSDQLAGAPAFLQRFEKHAPVRMI